jgi:hypothetical protein
VPIRAGQCLISLCGSAGCCCNFPAAWSRRWYFSFKGPSAPGVSVAIGLAGGLVGAVTWISLLAPFIEKTETTPWSSNTLPGKGHPIGNLISQHLANYYLGCLDHWVKEELQVRYYLRYMDDFILFSDTKKNLQQQLVDIRTFLYVRLNLQLKKQYSAEPLQLWYSGCDSADPDKILSRFSGQTAASGSGAGCGIG